ncbi:MAG: TonB-dependent receptor [Desulfobacterium sp.]|nr:TonB-dependent receptor [Desulfobacterium sp.]
MNHKLRVLLITLMAFFAIVPQTFSDDTEKKSENRILAPGPGKIFMNLGEVVVREESDDTKNIDLPGSVDVLGYEKIQYENLDNALEILRKVPGITIGDYGNGGVPNGFTFRGHDMNSHGSHTVITIDGIPINSHLGSADGAPDLNQLTPEEIQRVDVIKGPIDARYGNWSRAGVIHYHTPTRGDFQKTKIALGSWDSQKAYVSLGSEHADGRFNQIYSCEYYTTEGWRDNTERTRQNAYGKWFYRPTENTQLGLLTHAYKSDWDTGGYLGETLWEQDPRQSSPTSEDDGGYKDLTEASIHLDWDINGNMPLETKAWIIDDDYARYADWGSGQTESYWENKTYGFLTNLGRDFSLARESRLRIDMGLDWRRFESHGEKWNTSARARNSKTSDTDYTFENYGAYLKVNYDPLSSVRLFAGIRHDRFNGDGQDNMGGSARDMKDYDVTTYKGGITITPLERYSFYANAATTFQLPNGTAKYVENAGNERDFFYWELGFKADPVDWISFRYAYSEQEEEIFREIQGVWVDEGDGIRKIHEVELNLFPLEHLELFTSYTYHDTEYTKGPNAGNELRCIPGYIWKLGMEYTLPWKTTELRIWYTDADAWYTDGSNQHAYEGYRTVDFKVIQHISDKWTLALDVKNLTDETYSEYVSFWSGENQYAGSNPRAFYLTLKYDLM